MLEDVEHYKGCNCKKSGCLKKYCECFQVNILCSDKCKCMDCKNFEGSEERNALFHGIPANSVAMIQQTTNAAINGAIGTPPSKKSKNQRMLFWSTPNDPSSRLRQFSQETRLASDASYHPLSSIHLSIPDSAKTLEPTFCRSSLAGMIQSHNVKDLCALLVKDSAEAARTFTEEKTMITNDEGVTEANISVVSSLVYHKDNGNSGRYQEVGVRTSLDDFPHISLNPNTRMPMESSSMKGLSPLYVEQEKLVLTNLNCFFKELISRHMFEETKEVRKVDNCAPTNLRMDDVQKHDRQVRETSCSTTSL